MKIYNVYVVFLNKIYNKWFMGYVSIKKLFILIMFIIFNRYWFKLKLVINYLDLMVLMFLVLSWLFCFYFDKLKKNNGNLKIV